MGSSYIQGNSLPCLPHQAYLKDMAKLGLVDIDPKLLQKMSDRLKQKHQYKTDAMHLVADHMNLKPCADAQFSQVNSTTSALTVNTHTADRN